VAGCGDGSIRVCFLEGAIDEENRSGDAAHQGPVRSLLFSATLNDEQGRPLPRRLFSLGEDGELKLWTLDQRRKPRTVPIGRNASALALFEPLPQAKPAVAAGQTGTARRPAGRGDGKPADLAQSGRSKRQSIR